MNRFSPLTGIVMVVFAMTICSCTTTDVISDILSSTTPGSSFTRDGLVKEDQKALVFARVNFENLKTRYGIRTR